MTFFRESEEIDLASTKTTFFDWSKMISKNARRNNDAKTQFTSIKSLTD